MKTATLFLLFAFMATGLTAAPPNPAFDLTVNGTYLAPNGQLPDAEVGLSYDDANVSFIPQQQTQTNFAILGFYYSGSTPSNPPGITVTPWVVPAELVGTPTTVGTYTVGIQTVWMNTFTLGSEDGVIQYYQLEVRPAGYGVTYPPAPSPPGGGSSSKSSGGSDSSCSTVAGSGPLFGGTLATLFGVLFWRREKKPRISPARTG